jgi:hypothetical protein
MTIRKPKSHTRSPGRSRGLIPLLALLAAAFLAGCFDAKEEPRVAGGDDIPNDVEPLGKKSARERDDSADWNGFKAMPRTSPGMYDTTTVIDSMPDTTGSGKAQPKAAAPAPMAAAAQAKRGAIGPDEVADKSAATGTDEMAIPPLDNLTRPLDTLITKVVDSVKGTLETVHTQVKDSILKVDSTVFVPADSANPGAPKGVLQVSGRLVLADTSLWRAYRFRDADGDGFLAPRAGSLNLADLDVSVKGVGGLVQRTVQRVAAGADLDFNGHGDNRILSSLVATTLGDDTLDVFRLLDADGDSIVLDFGKDTNLVDLIEEHRDPADPSLVSVSVKARIVVFSKDSTRNYAIRYQRTVLNADGSVLEVTTRGDTPRDTSFRAGADAVWTETLARPSGDSLVARARAYTMRLADEPGAFQENVLKRLFVEETYSGLSYDRFAFQFVPERPIADGKWPATGAVAASISYWKGETIIFTGEAVAGGMEGTVATAFGTVIPIFFDRNGAATRRP